MTAMKLLKDPNLSVLHRVFGRRGGDHLSVAVLAGFTLDESQTPLEEAAIWSSASQALGPEQVLDAGMPKSRGEVLVLGKCFAPPGKEIQGATAFFKVGRLEKRVEVFGDRFFETGLVRNKRIQALPFTEMDISWENAFGGPGHDRNPVGKGLTPVLGSDGKRLMPMPNIENPGRLMTSPDERPEPAGMGPLGLNWPNRVKKLGTFDKKWLTEQWPGLPDDFNYDYFNLAPADQRIEGFFKGDEFIIIRGMHPERHEIECRLPDLRCRIFVNRQNGTEDEFEEVQAKLDTVYFIPHLDMGFLIWHGTTPITDDEAEDVRHILAYTEPMKESPLPEEFYRAKLEEPALAVAGPGEAEALASEEALPEEAVPSEPDERAADAETLGQAPAVDQELEEMLAGVEKEIAEKEAELNDHLLEHGVNPDVLNEPPAPPISRDAGDVSVGKMLAEKEAQVADLENRLRDRLAAEGLNPDDYVGENANVIEPQKNPFSLEARTAEEFVKFYKGQGVDDPELLAQLRGLFDETNAVQAEERQAWQELEALTGADAPDEAATTSAERPEAEAAGVEEARAEGPKTGDITAGEPETGDAGAGDGARLTREDVIAGHAQGKSFAGADLTGLDLSNCDLSGADLKGAVLENVDFSQTNLEGAALRQAVMTGAKLIGARMAGADLAGAGAAEARLTGADLSGSNLSDADLTDADLSNANLEQADLTNGLLNRAVLNGAGCGKIIAAQAVFDSANLTGADFRDADLSQADLSGVQANDARFSKANAGRARLYGAKGERTDFEGADLNRSRGGKETSFSGGRFANADLNNACWEDADLSGADLSAANLARAQMNKCRFNGARLTEADAREADLSKSDFSEADMKSVNLMDGSLRKARLVQTDLGDSNLYRVDFYKSTHGRTNLKNANLDRTLIDRS